MLEVKGAMLEVKGAENVWLQSVYNVQRYSLCHARWPDEHDWLHRSMLLSWTKSEKQNMTKSENLT